MAITRDQMISLGFNKIKLTHFGKEYYSLVYPINATDYLYSGYDRVTKKSNFKIIWISKVIDGSRINYPLEHMRDVTFRALDVYVKKVKYIEDQKILQEKVNLDYLVEDAGDN